MEGTQFTQEHDSKLDVSPQDVFELKCKLRALIQQNGKGAPASDALNAFYKFVDSEWLIDEPRWENEASWEVCVTSFGPLPDDYICNLYHLAKLTHEFNLRFFADKTKALQLFIPQAEQMLWQLFPVEGEEFGEREEHNAMVHRWFKPVLRHMKAHESPGLTPEQKLKQVLDEMQKLREYEWWVVWRVLKEESQHWRGIKQKDFPDLMSRLGHKCSLDSINRAVTTGGYEYIKDSKPHEWQDIISSATQNRGTLQGCIEATELANWLMEKLEERGL